MEPTSVGNIFIEQQNLYNMFNMTASRYCVGFTAGSDPYTVAQSPIPGYLCPSDPTDPSPSYAWNGSILVGATTAWATNYAAISSITGVNYEKSFIPSTGYAGMPTMPNPIQKFTDGLSNTAMISEIFRGKTLLARSSGSCPGVAGALTTLDGTYCSNPGPTPTVWPAFARCAMWTVEQGFGCQLDATRGPNSKLPDQIRPGTSAIGSHGAAGNWDQTVTASSPHAGGVFALYGDGSVHFINEAVNLSVWRSTCTYDGMSGGFVNIPETVPVYSEL